MQGDADGSFRPDDPISRAEVAVIALRWKQQPAGSESATYSDTSLHWAMSTIETVKQKGWMSGYADNTFAPDRTITRAEMVVTMNRLLERGPLHGIEAETWKDVPKSYWAAQAIDEASVKHQSTRLPNGSETVLPLSK